MPFREFVASLLRECYTWARTQRIHVTENPTNGPATDLRVYLRTFFDELSANGKTIFCLWDEIQRWFVVEDPVELNASFFKAIVSPPIARKNVHFVVTGSGMVRAWTGFLKAPANSHTLPNTAYVTTIFANEDDKISDLAKDLLKKAFPAANLPDALLNGTSKNPAGLSYAVIRWMERDLARRNVEDLVAELSAKYLEEFNSDMLPLLQEMRDDQRLKVRQLAYQVCEHDPNQLFGTLYTTFFKPFIKEYASVDPVAWSLYDSTQQAPKPCGKVWGFVTSEFLDLIKTYIKSDGSLHAERLPFGGSLVTLYQVRAFHALARIGEYVKKPTNNPNTALVQQIDAIFATHAKAHNWEITSSTFGTHKGLQYLLQHPANQKGTAQKIISMGANQPFLYCLYLQLLRNLVVHHADNVDDLRHAVPSLPPAYAELLSAIKQAQVFNTLSLYW
jgi:hypothetical protein